MRLSVRQRCWRKVFVFVVTCDLVFGACVEYMTCYDLTD